jgi:hypothetical protein
MTSASASRATELAWFKSSFSGGNGSGSNCVEAAHRASGMAVRDSKNPDGPNRAFSASAWTAFVAGIKRA